MSSKNYYKQKHATIQFNIRKISLAVNHLLQSAIFPSPRALYAAQVWLLASSQDRWRSTVKVSAADALKVWLRCVGIFDWNHRQKGEKRKKECRQYYETRPPGWYYSLNWTLTVQTCCLEPVLIEHGLMSAPTQYRIYGWQFFTGQVWAEVNIAQSCRLKGRSLYCPEAWWREVEDSLQSRRVATCTTGEACLSKTSTERTTESQRQSYKRPGKVAVIR